MVLKAERSIENFVLNVSEMWVLRNTGSFMASGLRNEAVTGLFLDLVNWA